MVTPAAKDFLRNTIRNTSYHNKMLEEDDMWRQWDLERGLTMMVSDDYIRRHDNFGPHIERSGHGFQAPVPLMDIPIYVDDRRRAEQQRLRKHKDRARNDDRSTYWMKKLVEAEETIPERWGHSGYKELYPEDFGTNRRRRTRSVSASRRRSRYPRKLISPRRRSGTPVKPQPAPREKLQQLRSISRNSGRPEAHRTRSNRRRRRRRRTPRPGKGEKPVEGERIGRRRDSRRRRKHRRRKHPNIITVSPPGRLHKRRHVHHPVARTFYQVPPPPTNFDVELGSDLRHRLRRKRRTSESSLSTISPSSSSGSANNSETERPRKRVAKKRKPGITKEQLIEHNKKMKDHSSRETHQKNSFKNGRKSKSPVRGESADSRSESSSGSYSSNCSTCKSSSSAKSSVLTDCSECRRLAETKKTNSSSKTVAKPVIKQVPPNQNKVKSYSGSSSSACSSSESDCEECLKMKHSK